MAELSRRPTRLHTSKRMHFIEDSAQQSEGCAVLATCIRQNVCTSLRMEGNDMTSAGDVLAYVKTYALH